MAAVVHCIYVSLLMSEVKQCLAWSVLGWETAWEHWVLLAVYQQFLLEGRLNSNNAPLGARHSFLITPLVVPEG